MKTLALAALLLSASLSAQQPDNSKVNKRDRQDQSVTPGDQSNDPKDMEVTRKIRKDVVAIKDISTNGKNVKIITAGGWVTLRGPVNSAEEKESIETVAKKVAGADKVKSEIEVKTN